MPITRPLIIQKPFAESGDKNTIPVASQVGITDGAASFETGFPPDTMIDIGDGGIAPDGLDMNGILNIITQHLRFWLAGGYPRFDATLCTEIGGYPVGTILQDNGGVNLYRNILANNTTDFNTTPASIGVSWIWLTGQTRSITAGTGLTGGGVPATADVTLNMGTPGTCSSATSNAATADSHTHALTLPDPGSVAAGNGLTGGGGLPGNLTLTLGTPGTCSGETANVASADSHTHAFDAASTGVAGAIRVATDSESYAGLLELVAVPPKGLASVLTTLFGKRSFNENDYLRIPDVPGGLILQWCKIVDNGNTNSFPIAFSTAVLGMVASVVHDGYFIYAPTVFPVSTTQFRARTGVTPPLSDSIYVFSWGF